MTVEIAFGSLGLLSIVGSIWGGLRYRHGLNPLTVFLVVEIGFFTLLPGMIAYFRDSEGAQLLAIDWRDNEIIQTTLAATAYALGNMAIYVFYPNQSIAVFHRAMQLFCLSSEQTGRLFNPIKLAALVTAALTCFICLAAFGGGGMLWLTSTRDAYITYRAGAGPFFAATQWFVNIGLIYTLWSRRPRLLGTAIYALLFAAPLYFTGSKNAILTVLVMAGVYYHFCVRRIPVKVVLFAALPVATVATVALQSLYGTDGSFWDGLYYFNYFSTTATFLGRFDEFGFMYGEAATSQLWMFVPRALYPDKPYEYGTSLIHKVLFPGFAELGHTPGILPWAMWYLDFGMYGVFVIGLMDGWMRRTAYEHYQRHPRSLFAFIIMVQLSVWPLFHYAPMLFVLVFCACQAILLGVGDQRGHAPLGRQPRTNLRPASRTLSPSLTGKELALHENRN